jgi:hypothetical protein
LEDTPVSVAVPGVLPHGLAVAGAARNLVLLGDPQQLGTNPVPDFAAIVSCQSIGAGGTAAISDVSTAQFPASTARNSDINATVRLPRPCIAPIVFVTSPGGAWSAATGS